ESVGGRSPAAIWSSRASPPGPSTSMPISLDAGPVVIPTLAFEFRRNLSLISDSVSRSSACNRFQGWSGTLPGLRLAGACWAPRRRGWGGQSTVPDHPRRQQSSAAAWAADRGAAVRLLELPGLVSVVDADIF